MNSSIGERVCERISHRQTTISIDRREGRKITSRGDPCREIRREKERKKERETGGEGRQRKKKNVHQVRRRSRRGGEGKAKDVNRIWTEETAGERDDIRTDVDKEPEKDVDTDIDKA